MHLKRWITSIIALPLLGALVFKGGPALFALLIGMLSLVAWWEYIRIVMTRIGRGSLDSLAVLGFIISALVIWAAYCDSLKAILGLMTINLIVSGMVAKLEFKHDQKISDAISRQMMGIVYVPGFLSFLVLIRNDVSGIAWIILLVCVIFSGDVAAYYVGSYLGRHQLCPNISPKKTIEGAFGGLAANIFVGSLIKYVYFSEMSWLIGIVFFVCIGFVGQVGDLFASVLKRSANVKDSGFLLPGHGGILDRVDALMFAAPIAYLFKEFIL